jgi:hypothetical protein
VLTGAAASIGACSLESFFVETSASEISFVRALLQQRLRKRRRERARQVVV